ncbi:MAG: hypothetical protein ACD_78C00197G0019 [uncultured bacterium (gcode 4)]|uniref:Uncharacterized protein n=1 Tax=uncultured bacterium (gcode 4) TaxID=1234023 RepID=K1YX93_9BACT|nr:MAG: hypothetical protein ACD_78C00197G0019 [uncultured bacterium (gcode 4)]
MIYLFFNKIAIFIAIIFLFLGFDTAWASGFQIDSSNYSHYLATQEGVFSLEGKNIVLSGSGQSVVVIKTGDIRGVVDMVQFSDFSYKLPSAVFLWKVRGQEYDPKNQMQLALKERKLQLPKMPDLENFDFIGFVFFEPSVTFSAVELRQTSFSDKISVFIEPELVKPSTINLLYGAKFGSTPFVAILGVLSIFLFWVLVFLNRKWAFISLLVLWVLFDLRYSYDQYSIFKTTYKTFIAPDTPQEKIYYDFHNLYGFIEESRKYIDADVNFYAPRDWPFHSNYLYHMYPLQSTWLTTDKPYYALFQIGNVEIKNGKELFIEGKLIDSNVELLYQFDEHSYILKKN